MSSFAERFTYIRESWEERDTALHIPVIQGIIFLCLNDEEWVVHGVMLAGQLDITTASCKSPSSAKISGAEAVFFVLPMLC